MSAVPSHRLDTAAGDLEERLILDPPFVERDRLSAQRFATLPKERRALLLHVSGLLDEIAFGTVVIVTQDGKVIQIETSEKIRLG